MKLDAQARDLANLNRQADLLNPEPGTFRRSSLRSQPTGYAARPLGTRISARLRGSQEEEWQSVPKEWLDEENDLQNGKTDAKPSKTGLESDEDAISDLTELSEDVSDDSKLDSPNLGGKLTEGPTIEHRENSEELQTLDNTHVEWETVSELYLYSFHTDFGEDLHNPRRMGSYNSTLWKSYTLQWEGTLQGSLTRHSSNRHSRAQSKVFPIIFKSSIYMLWNQEIEEKRRLEEAIVHRKRSSRIAVKESEREEARLAAKKKREDEEKRTRARRLEARLQKEEIGRLKRENARQKRKKEREAREQSRKAVTSM